MPPSSLKSNNNIFVREKQLRTVTKTEKPLAYPKNHELNPP